MEVKLSREIESRKSYPGYVHILIWDPRFDVMVRRLVVSDSAVELSRSLYLII